MQYLREQVVRMLEALGYATARNFSRRKMRQKLPGILEMARDGEMELDDSELDELLQRMIEDGNPVVVSRFKDEPQVTESEPEPIDEEPTDETEEEKEPEEKPAKKPRVRRKSSNKDKLFKFYQMADDKSPSILGPVLFELVGGAKLSTIISYISSWNRGKDLPVCVKSDD